MVNQSYVLEGSLRASIIFLPIEFSRQNVSKSERENKSASDSLREFEWLTIFGSSILLSRANSVLLSSPNRDLFPSKNISALDSVTALSIQPFLKRFRQKFILTILMFSAKFVYWKLKLINIALRTCVHWRKLLWF